MGLIDDQKQMHEANLLLAQDLEHGINGQDINIKEAAELYKKTFDNGKGLLRAGNYLARIYQKDKKHKKENEEKAIKIYSIIASSEEQDSSTSIAYAKYRLARIDQAKILHDQDLEGWVETVKKNRGEVEANQYKYDMLHEKIEKVIKNYDEVIKIKNIKESKFHAKILYNKALMELELAEYEKNILLEKFKETIKEEPSLSKSRIRKLEKKLIEDIKSIKEIKTAKSILAKSEKLGYKKARAELINIEARNALLINDRDEAIKKSDEALTIDSKNINAKLIKANAYKDRTINKAHRREDNNKSLVIVRGILKQDPENITAQKLKAGYIDELVEEIASQLSQNIKDRTEEFIPDTFSYQGINIYRNSMHKERDNRIEEIKHQLKESLKDEEYILDHAMFDNRDDIVEELNKYIYPEIQEDLKESIVNYKDKAIQIKDKVGSNIFEWAKKHINNPTTYLEPGDRELINKRKEFKNELVRLLIKNHDECRIVTAKDSGVTFEEGEKGWYWSCLGYLRDATPLAIIAANQTPFIGSTIGSFLAAGNLGANGLIKWYERSAKLQAYEGGKKFASIGADANGTPNPEKAKKDFNFIADRLVEIYGMQLNKVHPADIAKLADIANRKMTSHLYKNLYDRRFPPKITSDLQLETLLEGITEGKLSTDKVEIRTTDDNVSWVAEDMFEKPAITMSGEELYLNKDCNATLYGTRYNTSVPASYTRNDSSAKGYAAKIQDNLGRHKRLLELDNNIKKASPEEYKEKKDKIDLVKLASDKRKSRKNLFAWVGVATFGGALTYTASAITAINFIGGAHPALTALVATIGVSASVIVPVVAASLAITGIGLLSYGIYKAKKSANRLERLESKHMKLSVDEQEEVVSKSPEDLKIEAEELRQKEFMIKKSENAKYTADPKVKSSDNAQLSASEKEEVALKSAEDFRIETQESDPNRKNEASEEKKVVGEWTEKHSKITQNLRKRSRH